MSTYIQIEVFDLQKPKIQLKTKSDLQEKIVFLYALSFNQVFFCSN